MKSGALLPSNLPSVIDRSNLSPSREAQGTQKTDNRTDSRNGDSREWNSAALLANNAQFMSIDPIGEKNQVILE